MFGVILWAVMLVHVEYATVTPNIACVIRFTRASITKHHRCRGIKQQKFIFSHLQGLEVQDQGVARLVSLEASLLGL